MVTTKCCVGIIIGVLVAAGVAVGIYFATASGGSKKAPEANEVKDPKVVLAKTKHSIVAYDLANERYHDMVKVDEGLYSIISFDYYINGTVYYATNGAGSPIQSSVPQEHPSLPNYTGNWIKTNMAVDQLTGKIYVVDRIEGKIYVVDVLGQHHKDLMTGLDGPLDIILNHVKGEMLVLTKSSIILATMSGVKGKELIQKKKSDLRAMAVDFTNERLYYAAGDQIMMYDLKTSQEKVLYTREVISLAVQDEKVLFISKDKYLYQCDDMSAATISCNRYASPRVEAFESIKTYGHLVTIEGATSPCGEDNGGCQHLCLLTPSEEGYVCDCDDGLKLDENKKSCIAA